MPHHNSDTREAGFSMTELVAALLITSALILGLADITRRYAVSTSQVKEIGKELRNAIVIERLFADVERIDPGTLELSAERLSATIGKGTLSAALSPDQSGGLRLEWKSPAGERKVIVPAGARFIRGASGVVALTVNEHEPALAFALPGRDLPFDCRFDTVVRECR